MSDQTGKSKPRDSNRDVLPEEVKDSKKTQSEEGFGWAVETEDPEQHPASPQAEPGAATGGSAPHPAPGTSSTPDHHLQENSPPPRGPLSPSDQEAPPAAHSLDETGEASPAPVADIAANAPPHLDVEPFSSASDPEPGAGSPARTHAPPPFPTGSAPTPGGGHTPATPGGGHTPATPAGVTPTPGGTQTPPTPTGVTPTPGSGHTPPTPTGVTPTPGGTQTPPTTTAARIAGLDTDTVIEDQNVVGGRLSAGGLLSVADPDAGEARFQAVTGAPGSAGYGSFAVAENGHWTYSADNNQAVIQALRPGHSLVDRFTVHSADGTAHELRVVITGTNDAPALSAATASATEDGKTVTGQMSATDIDHGDSQTYAAGQPVDGFSMNPDGSWSFDPSHAAYQHLADGQTQQITIPVTVTDSAGATDTENLVITVTGTNDAPVVSGPVDLGSGTEDKAVQITLPQLLAHVTDVDSTDTLSVTGLSASHGTITGDAAHGFTFTPDPNYNGPVTLSYQVTDGHGGTVQQTASLQLAATPDAAVITGTDTGDLTEDRNVGPSSVHTLAVSGSLSVHDPDGPSQEFFQSSRFGEHAISDPFGGNLHIDRVGNWGYEVDNSHPAVQSLAAGQEGHAVYEVHSADGTAHRIQITIHGTNDAPVLSAATASATEDGSAVTGQMSATDIDHGDSQTYAAGQPVDGFSMNPDGSWSFDPSHAAYQHLADGQTQQITIPVTVTDSAGATDTENLVITVTGTNDAPVVSGPVDLGSGTEDKAVQITLPQLLAHVTDVDSTDTLSVTGLSASHGTITGDAAHGFTFTPDPNYNGPVTLSYQVTDGLGGTALQSASLTLVPVGDPAIIGGQDKGDVTEDNTTGLYALSANGKLTISDPDAGEAKFVSYTSYQMAYPTSLGGNSRLTIYPWGTWHYDGDNNLPQVQALKAGETLIDTITVRSVDGTTHKIEITIHGTNDAPVLSAASASATEDGSAVTGQMPATDVDAGDTKSFSAGQPVDGFSMNPDGSWSFDPSHAAYQHLADGQTQQVTIPVTVTDSAGATDTETLVITVTGTNDAPVVSGPVDLGSGTEDKAVQISAAQLLAHATDIDTGDALSVTGLSASHGTISGDAAHGFTFTPDPNYNGPVHLSDQVTDGHGGTVQQTASLQLAATPDAAVITGTDTGDLTEDRNVGPSSAHPLAVSGSLSVHDPDGPSQQFFQSSRFGEHAISDPFGGSLHIDRIGNWGYEVDNTHPAVQALAAGQEGHAVYQVHSADGTAHRIQITIHGTNDAPVLSAASASATEDGSAVTGQMSATDLDAGDTKTFASSQPIDGFSMNPDGSWSFDPSHAAYQHLADGQTQQITIPVTVTDSAGATDTETLVITVTGTNDGARITGTDSASVVEDRNLSGGNLTAGGTLTVTDADTGQDSFTPVTGQQGTGGYGSFSIDAQGHWTYTADNSQQVIQALDPSSTPLTDTLIVTSKDGTQHTLTVAIHGTADAPAVKPSVATVQGVGSQHLTGMLTSSAPGGWAIDNGHGGAVQSLQGQFGTLTIDPQTGHFEYHYQQNSGVIKQGGSSVASGQHVDTFHITQQGVAAGDADVQVQIDVQSVHGNSGHHVDHTVLQGITFTPMAPVQHDAPDDVDTVEVTLDLSDAAPMPAPSSSAQDIASASLDLDHTGTGPDSVDTDAAASPLPVSPADPESDRLAAYFDAIGQGHDAAPSPMAPAAHLSSYLDAAGAAPDIAATVADLPDPSMLDVDALSADVEDRSQEAAEQQQGHDVPQELPEPVLPDPNDDTSQYG